MRNKYQEIDIKQRDIDGGVNNKIYPHFEVGYFGIVNRNGNKKSKQGKPGKQMDKNLPDGFHLPFAIFMLNNAEI